MNTLVLFNYPGFSFGKPAFVSGKPLVELRTQMIRGTEDDGVCDHLNGRQYYTNLPLKNIKCQVCLAGG